jgi:hypothetical protein
MPILAVAGVPFPVTIDSMKLSYELVGAKNRNARGHSVLERRRAKTVIEFTTGPKPLDEAMLYRALVLGEGEFWSTLTSSYGAKGLQLTGTGVINTGGGGNPIATNGVFRTTVNQTLIVPGRFYDQSPLTVAPSGITGATLVGWRFDGSAYRIFAFSWRSLDVVVANKREMLGSLGASGTAQAYTGTETLSVSGGALTITAPATGGPWSWSNLLVLPWFFPNAQLDALMLGFSLTNYTQPLLPRVYVTSDLLPTNQLMATPGLVQASLICTGEVESLVVRPLLRNGTFSTTECVLSGRLTEV